MKLADYLQLKELTPLEFGELIGVKGPATVHRYVNGDRQPNDEVLRRIEIVTGGLVTRYDFRPAGNVHLAGDCPEASLARNDNEAPPWARSTLYARQRVNRAFKRMMKEPVEGNRLSAPLRQAVDLLGSRVQMDRGQRYFRLDGRPAGAQEIVRAANRILLGRGQTEIAYPGVLRSDNRQ